jgi:glycosyltransferase involved in cell wall biosynthesis
MKISVIMAVFNEEKFLNKSLTALMNQTLKPSQIIVVDDGSTDKSPEIISKYNVAVLRLPVKKESSIERYPHVLSVGSKKLQENFDYVGIIDADTILEQEYYEKLTQQMTKVPAIGIASGDLVGQASTGPIFGMIPYAYGANRLYTRKCWLKLNNGKIMKPIPQIDFYHNVYAEMLGFKTQRFNDVKSWHLRPTRMGDAFTKGYHAYEFGYYWHYLLLRAIRNRSPAMIAGYLKAQFSQAQEYPIKPFLRQLQNNRLKRIITRLIP